MKITAIETLELSAFPNLLWVEVTSDAGIVGLGETFYGAAAVAAFIHETAAPYLLGRDPLQIEKHNRHFLSTLSSTAPTSSPRASLPRAIRA